MAAAIYSAWPTAIETTGSADVTKIRVCSMSPDRTWRGFEMHGKLQGMCLQETRYHGLLAEAYRAHAALSVYPIDCQELECNRVLVRRKMTHHFDHKPKLYSTHCSERKASEPYRSCFALSVSSRFHSYSRALFLACVLLLQEGHQGRDRSILALCCS